MTNETRKHLMRKAEPKKRTSKQRNNQTNKQNTQAKQTKKQTQKQIINKTRTTQASETTE